MKTKRKGKGKKTKHRLPMDTFMLGKVFQAPLVLMTYDGLHLLDSVTEISKYELRAATLKPEASPDMTFKKDACLFCVPVEKWTAVKPHIKRRAAIAEKGLGPQSGLYKRPCVQGVPMKQPVKVLLRNGLVLHGRIVDVDTFHLMMRVGEKIVIVWKHAVERLERTEPDNDTEDASE